MFVVFPTQDVIERLHNGETLKFGPKATNFEKEQLMNIVELAAGRKHGCIGISTYGWGSDSGGIGLVCKPNIV